MATLFNRFIVLVSFFVFSNSWGNGFFVKNTTENRSTLCLIGDNHKECKELQPKEKIAYDNSNFSKSESLKFAFLEEQFESNLYQISDGILVDKDGVKIEAATLKEAYNKIGGCDVIIDDILDRSIVLECSE